MTRSMSLVAVCSAAAGCRGSGLDLFMIAVIIIFVIARSVGNGIAMTRRRCPHCGHAGATEHFHEKGFVDYVTCDHCGKEM